MAQNIIDQAGSVAQIQSYLLPTGSGFALSNVEYTGSLAAAGVFDSLNLSPSLQFSRGVLLTSGDGTPARSNTSNSYSQDRGVSGNADLNAFAAAAFGGAGTTHDAAILTLTFTVTDANVKSLSFDIAFGTDEYPEYVASSYVDIGAVWTGTGSSAMDYALINGSEPLAVTSENLSLGNFIDNTSGGLAIEYDGLVNRQTILVPVELGENVIRIGVADTGDFILDSGLFIFGIQGSGSENTGTFQEIQVSAGGDYDSSADNNIFTGTAGQFNNTSFNNFSSEDQIFVNGSFFSGADALLGVGSLDIKLDTDGNDKVDTTITVEDPIQNATVVIAPTEEGTSITLELLQQATAGADTITGAEGLDYLGGADGNDVLSGLGGSDALSGGAGNDKLFGGAGADDLNGGEGADLLEGGAAGDTLRGGAEADVFFFDSAAGPTGRDKILDFGSNDLLVTTTKIFDSNNDNIITFGVNKLLDLFNGGLVEVINASGKAVTKIAYEGSFEAGGELYFVYAASHVAGSLNTAEGYFTDL